MVQYTEHAPTMEFNYKNWKGKISKRRVVPYEIWFGNTEFHSNNQWFLNAFDVDKKAERNFALKDVVEFL